MPPRCLLFSSDEGTAATIRQVLHDLEVEAESCPEATLAIQKLAQQAYQFVIIDWDQQPESGLLLEAARERKAGERPLTLAIVSNDASAPKALQAGANSILRRPIVLGQVKDTLKTARDLLRARQESAAAAAAGAQAGSAHASPPASLPSGTTPNVAPFSSTPDSIQGSERTLRTGEFLQPSASTQASQFDTESDQQKSFERSALAELDPLKGLEPMAAAVAPAKAALAKSDPPAPPPITSDEPRGLQWFLNRRAATAPLVPATPPGAPAQGNPDLVGFDQMPSQVSETQATEIKPTEIPRRVPSEEAHAAVREKKDEAELFAYISGEDNPSESETRQPFRLGKGAIAGALVLAACAVAAAPQAPWHPAMRALWGRERIALHAWLNPQVVTPTQAPESHESFTRAGDEYKLPVAETIPDATTDPTQIRVTPVVDPTAKKTNPAAGGNADQSNPTDAIDVNAEPPQSTPQPSPQSAQASETQEAPVGTAASPSSSSQSLAPGANSAPVPASAAPQPVPAVSRPATNTQAPASQPTPQGAAPQVRPISAVVSPGIPSSLQSQMATSTPEASGNKPVEAALPSIEPVNVPEAAERALLIDQPAPAYPAGAKSQQGTVTLQVLVGRDGTVQDAKFLQGSLAFAHAAIDGVRQWKFKPYMLNGHAVSVQTLLTISFKPATQP